MGSRSSRPHSAVTDVPDPKKNPLHSSTIRLMLLSAWAVVLLITLSMVATSLYFTLFVTGEMPTPLREWTGVCIGFATGSLFSLIASYMQPPQSD